jgi:hypothetical protein
MGREIIFLIAPRPPRDPNKTTSFINAVGSFPSSNEEVALSWPLTITYVGIKNAWSLTSISSHAVLSWRLIKNRDNIVSFRHWLKRINKMPYLLDIYTVFGSLCVLLWLCISLLTVRQIFFKFYMGHLYLKFVTKSQFSARLMYNKAKFTEFNKWSYIISR